MSRRLDMGVAVYGKPEALARTVAAIQKHSVTDWRLFLIVNPHPRVDMKEVVSGLADRDSRIVPVWMATNSGYAGACNELLRTAVTEYIAFVDDDATIMTHGWDETLSGYLDRFHEIGMIFPNGGAYQIDRGAYTEVMWGVGFCWMMNRMCASDINGDLSILLAERMFAESYKGREMVFNEFLGHQEEADVSQRVRMAGWKCAAVPSVCVNHAATSTNDPASVERINRGVVKWVNLWNAYFNGKNFNYHSPNVTRFEDWPPQALYLEEYWKLRMPDLNAKPEVIVQDGREYDLIRVPRFKSFYTNRII